MQNYGEAAGESCLSLKGHGGRMVATMVMGLLRVMMVVMVAMMMVMGLR